jgi:hypothetical protein
MGWVPSNKSMVNSISRSGGNPDEISARRRGSRSLLVCLLAFSPLLV